MSLKMFLRIFRNLLSGDIIHRVLSRSVLRNQVLRNNVLGHNIHRNNCCNVSFTVSGLFRLFRFGAFTVHGVSSVHGLRFGKMTFSHQALSEIFNGNFVLPWKRPLCSAFPKTVFQPVSNRA